MEKLQRILNSRTKNLVSSIRLKARVRNISSVIMGSSFLQQMVVFVILLRATISLGQFKLQPTDLKYKEFYDSSTMNVKLYFTPEFEGALFVKRQMFHPNCSYITSVDSTVSSVELKFRLKACGLGSKVSPKVVNATIVIQMHRLIRTVLDQELFISCRVRAGSYSHVKNRTPTIDLPVVRAKAELKLGSELFDGHALHVDSKPYFIVNVNYTSKSGKTYNGMIGHNCIAHDSAVLNENTIANQFSGPHGCPSSSETVPADFALGGMDDKANLTANSILRNVILFTKREQHVTCGVTLCEDACVPNCNGNGHSTPGHLSAIAVKDVVKQPRTRKPTNFHALTLKMRELQRLIWEERMKLRVSILTSARYLFSLTTLLDAYRMISGQRVLITPSIILSRHGFNS